MYGGTLMQLIHIFCHSVSCFNTRRKRTREEEVKHALIQRTGPRAPLIRARRRSAIGAPNIMVDRNALHEQRGR